MPRLEGRTSSRKVYDLDDLLVASFLMWGADDRFVGQRKCCAKGCDHFAKNCMTGKAAGPAVVVHKDNIDKHVGVICQHHVAELLDRED